MSMHTPSPWRVVEGRGDSLNVVSGPEGSRGFLIAEVTALAPAASDEEWAANARLISAAPDLFAACKAVFADFELHIRGRNAPGYQDHWKAVRAAIAKAEGKTS